MRTRTDSVALHRDKLLAQKLLYKKRAILSYNSLKKLLRLGGLEPIPLHYI